MLSISNQHSMHMCSEFMSLSLLSSICNLYMYAHEREFFNIIFYILQKVKINLY